MGMTGIDTSIIRSIESIFLYADKMLMKTQAFLKPSSNFLFTEHEIFFSITWLGRTLKLF